MNNMNFQKTEEKTYWLCILNRKNWEVVKKENVWGVSERHKNQLNKAKIGDVFIFYTISELTGRERTESEITGIFEVASKPYKDNKKLFSSVGTRHFGEIFPYRIKVKPLEIFENPIAFRPLTKKLSFITNKKRWSLHLLGAAMKAIPKEDYDLLASM
ncbi:MAG: EVE domain-containing protein [Methanocellales archaeon]|nr:EVE domain-containing protein [Methanocellales archaeon]